MPRDLVVEEEKVRVVAQREEPDQVSEVAMAPALVRVVWHQPQAATGLPKLPVGVMVVAEVPVQMGLAEKELERALVRGTVRVA
jgi:hypothetical protein